MKAKSARRRSRNILIQLPTANTHFSGIVGGAAAYLQGRPGWFLDVGASAKFRQAGDGLITALFRQEEVAADLPTVNVSNSLEHPGVATVVTDDRAVGELAAQYFIEQGQEAFAVFAPCTTRYARLRTEGFTRALAAGGHPVVMLGEPGLFDSMRVAEAERNIRHMRKLLAKLPRPCAVFAVDDLRAALLCRISLAAGYRIPQDFLLLGVDDNLVICDSTPLPLSSIALDSRGIGYRAAELLAAMLERQGRATAASAAATTPAALAAVAASEPGDPPLIELPPIKVVERASTESGTRRDPLVARALFFIDREFNQGLTIEALAQRIGVSPRYLQMRFKSALASTPQQALLERRLKEAKALLRQSDLSITAVAYASGFGDYKQMAHHLRRDCGKTARDYRQTVCD